MNSLTPIRFRFVVRDDRCVETAQPTAYVLANGFLTQHMLMASSLRMRPAKLLVFLTIAAATVQRLVRRRLASPMGGMEAADGDRFGFISRRAVAEAAGLPRENVRRLVDELWADGLLMSDERGRVANCGGLLEQPEMMETLRRMAHEVAKTAEMLVRAGVIEVRAGD